MSSKTAGRVAKYDKPLTVPVATVPSAPPRYLRKRRGDFSTKVAKQKLDKIEKNVRHG